MTNRRLFIICIAILLAGVVLCVALAAANARANALRRLLCQAWREHGVLPPAPDAPAGGVVTAQGAMQRLCWN